MVDCQRLPQGDISPLGPSRLPVTGLRHKHHNFNLQTSTRTSTIVDHPRCLPSLSSSPALSPRRPSPPSAPPLVSSSPCVQGTWYNYLAVGLSIQILSLSIGGRGWIEEEAVTLCRDIACADRAWRVGRSSAIHKRISRLSENQWAIGITRTRGPESTISYQERLRLALAGHPIIPTSPVTTTISYSWARI